MRVMVTGAKGMVGKEVAARFAGGRLLALDVEEMDITSRAEVHEAFSAFRPQAVVHCAAFTDVDGCEREPEKAYAVNAVGTRHVAEACRVHDAELVYISTDYVFDGAKEHPYIELDAPAPLGVYGKTKHAGELAVAQLLSRYFIVRTSWVFGDGRNFVRTILEAARTRDTLEVVGDQTGSPTYAPDLAGALAALVGTTHYGVYHVTNEGFTTWFDFAALILEEAGIEGVRLTKISSAALARPAPRPENSRLAGASMAAAGLPALRHYREALREYLTTLTKGAR